MKELLVTDLEKSYKESHIKKEVFKKVCLEADQGQFISIIGKSGSGKTTLLNCLAGLERADQGNCFYENTDVSALSAEEKAEFRKENIGYIHQEDFLLEELTIKENILLPLYLKKSIVDRMLYENVMEKLGLKKMEDELSVGLSKGEVQKIAAARAVICKPNILLADEPTSSLDAIQAKIVLDLLMEYQKIQNYILIVSTHDIPLAKQADKMYSLEYTKDKQYRTLIDCKKR